MIDSINMKSLVFIIMVCNIFIFWIFDLIMVNLYMMIRNYYLVLLLICIFIGIKLIVYMLEYFFVLLMFLRSGKD